jgi:hypothetical protein
MPGLLRIPLLLILFLGFFGPETSLGNAFKGGKVYEAGSQRKKLLFTIHADLLAPNPTTRTFVSRYVDGQGKEALTEQATFESFKLQKYTIHQEQLGETYELTVVGRKMRFRNSKLGKTEIQEQERDLPENLVIGPSFVPFLQQHWGELQRGDKVKAQLAVLEREDTYGFEFVKLRETKFDEQSAIVIRMNPTSSMVSAVVRPTYFTVAVDGSRILQIIGRMLPKLKAESRWVNFKGEAVFNY